MREFRVGRALLCHPDDSPPLMRSLIHSIPPVTTATEQIRLEEPTLWLLKSRPHVTLDTSSPGNGPYDLNRCLRVNPASRRRAVHLPLPHSGTPRQWRDERGLLVRRHRTGAHCGVEVPLR